MASFTYSGSIGERDFPLWEAWLAKISDEEATRALVGTGIDVGDTISNQTEYNLLMLTAQKYYKGIK